MHFKEFGFLYSGFLNHCQGTKRDCLWFFVLIQTMKVYQIISCQARISQGKKNVKVFKPTAHVFIIFSVQKVLHSWDCNNAKKDSKKINCGLKTLKRNCGLFIFVVHCEFPCHVVFCACIGKVQDFNKKASSFQRRINFLIPWNALNRTLSWGLRWK